MKQKVVKPGFEFNQKNTAWIRGMTAIFLVLIHTIEDGIGASNPILDAIAKCGFLCVAVYFFLSGFGLIVSIKEKPNYINGFMNKKIVRLLIPVYLSEVLYILFYAFSREREVHLYDVLFFWKYVRFSWFVLSIGVIYLIFFLVYRFINNRKWAFPFFIVSICITVAFCYLMGISTIYYKCCPAFIVGCFFAYYYEQVEKLLNKHYIGAIFAGGIILAFILAGYFANATIKNGLYSVVMCIVLILVSFKIRVSSKVTDKLSDISYELYLVHGLAILICSDIQGDLRLVLTLILALIMAYVMSYVKKYLAMPFSS